MTGGERLILLKKNRFFQTACILIPENAFLARRDTKSERGNTLRNVKISSSSAYFSAVETMADFSTESANSCHTLSVPID
jgi:hypothetical protein